MSKELANELVRTGGRYSRNLVITNLWEKVQNIRFIDYIALKSNSVVPSSLPLGSFRIQFNRGIIVSRLWNIKYSPLAVDSFRIKHLFYGNIY